MAEIVIPEMMQALKSLRLSKLNDIHVRYDETGDVMYVNIGAPLPADDSELGADDILYRYANGEVVGLTITYFSKR
jgi:uncharacterized protein YuzE